MALVTDIRTPRPGSRAREIVVDGDLWRTTSFDVLRTLGVRAGHVAPAEELATAIDAAEPRAARDRALRLLAYRERSVSEIGQRLAEDGYPHGVWADVVADLSHAGLVDDERYAASAARTLTRVRGYGRARALRELKARGVDPETAERALVEALPPEDEIDAARLLARAYARRPGADAGRVAARLVRKGYRQALAIRVAREIIAASDAPGPCEGNDAEALEPFAGDTADDLPVSDG